MAESTVTCGIHRARLTLPLLLVIQLSTASTTFAAGTYRINAAVDPSKFVMTGTADVSFVNDGDFPIRELLVGYMGEAIEGMTRLSAATADGDPVALEPTDGRDTNGSVRFLIRLPRRLDHGDRFDLRLSFSQAWPHSPGESWGVSSEWYPRIDPGFPTCYTFQVGLTAPAGMRYASTGIVVERKTVPGEMDLETIWFATNPVPRFVFDALDPGKWKEHTKDSEGVQVRAFWQEAHWDRWMKRFVEIACDVIAFNRKEFGVYPGKSLCIFSGDMGATGGGPVAPGIVAIHDVAKLGDRADRFAQWIVAHEIGHQYWGEYVLASDPSYYTDSWLSIGLGLYTDRWYAEARGLEGVSNHHRFGDYLRAVQAGLNTTINIGSGVKPEPDLDRNNAVVHSKGYAVIRALEVLMGPEVFRPAVDECLKTFAHREMSVEAFRRVCEKHAGADLRWFFRDWLDTAGALSYAVIDTEKSVHGDRHRTKVTLARTGEIAMPVPVRARFSDGSEQTNWTNRKLDFPVVFFESNSAAEELVVDPDHSLPMVERPAPPKPMALPPRTLEDVARANNSENVAALIVEAMGGYTSEECRKVAAHFARAVEARMEDQRAWMLLGMALYDGKRYEDALVAFERMADARGQRRGNALIWQGHLHDLLGNREKALGCYRTAIRVGIPPLQHGQYGINMSREYAEQHLNHPFERRNQ